MFIGRIYRINHTETWHLNVLTLVTCVSHKITEKCGILCPKTLLLTEKQLHAIHFFVATRNVCPMAITESCAQNMGLRLLEKIHLHLLHQNAPNCANLHERSVPVVPGRPDHPSHCDFLGCPCYIGRLGRPSCPGHLGHPSCRSSLSSWSYRWPGLPSEKDPPNRPDCPNRPGCPGLSGWPGLTTRTSQLSCLSRFSSRLGCPVHPGHSNKPGHPSHPTWPNCPGCPLSRGHASSPVIPDTSVIPIIPVISVVPVDRLSHLSWSSQSHQLSWPSRSSGLSCLCGTSQSFRPSELSHLSGLSKLHPISSSQASL